MFKKYAARQYKKNNPEARDPLIRILLFVVRLFVQIFYRPQYHGRHYIPSNKGYLLMGNHLSFADPLLIHVGVPHFVNWVSKAELFKSKLFGKLFRKMKMIPLHRHQADIKAMRAIKQKIADGEVLGIFPQGTRVPVDQYEKILAQPGVASICSRYGATIVPFYCSGPYKIFRKNHFYFGPAFSLNKSYKLGDKNELKQEMVNEIMRQCYVLGNKPYLEDGKTALTS